MVYKAKRKYSRLHTTSAIIRRTDDVEKPDSQYRVVSTLTRDINVILIKRALITSKHSIVCMQSIKYVLLE